MRARIGGSGQAIDEFLRLIWGIPGILDAGALYGVKVDNKSVVENEVGHERGCVMIQNDTHASGKRVMRRSDVI